MGNAYKCDGCGEYGDGVSFGSARLAEQEGADEFNELCASCCRKVREVLE